MHRAFQCPSVQQVQRGGCAPMPAYLTLSVPPSVPLAWPLQFLGEPYINQCDYDAAGDSLQWLYRNTLTPPDADFARAMGAAAVGGAVQASAICALAPGSVPMGKAKKASSTSAAASSSFTASQVPPCTDEVVAAARSLALPASIAPRSLLAGSTSLALAAPGSKVAATPILRAGNGSLYEFNQGLFVDGGGWDSTFGIAQFAYTYIPDACLASAGAGAAPAGGCLLHAVFHGCEQTLDDIGHTFMTGSNYIPWAQVSESCRCRPPCSVRRSCSHFTISPCTRLLPVLPFLSLIIVCRPTTWCCCSRRPSPTR